MRFLPVRQITLALCLTSAFGVALAKPAGTCSSDGPGGANLTSTVSGGSGLFFNELARTVVNTGTVNKTVFIWFAADAGVPQNAEVRLLFSLDGATPQYRGPQNLANQTQYYQSRSTLARISVPPGTHTITPYVYVSAAPGLTAVFDDRCMFVEI